MAQLETYRERFAESGWRIFERAIADARRRGQNCVTAAHLIQALLAEKPDFFGGLLKSAGVEAGRLVELAALVAERIAAGPQHEGAGVRLPAETTGALKLAQARARSSGRKRIEAIDIFFALLLDGEGTLRRLFGEMGLGLDSMEIRLHDIFEVSQSAPPGRPLRSGQHYGSGEVVRIRSGPFAAFTGRVEQVDETGSTLEVSVSIFGRRQPMTLRAEDVEKLPSLG
ncbi:MAG TPA: Clp protease N-terminal domain-containing protein [Pyrinomonadaceae bacterium]|jgi:ATP-dependent Clp protease ATP-binding subunit ClpA